MITVIPECADAWFELITVLESVIMYLHWCALSAGKLEFESTAKFIPYTHNTQEAIKHLDQPQTRQHAVLDCKSFYEQSAVREPFSCMFLFQ